MNIYIYIYIGAPRGFRYALVPERLSFPFLSYPILSYPILSYPSAKNLQNTADVYTGGVPLRAGAREAPMSHKDS